jgi:3'-5' exonuclease
MNKNLSKVDIRDVLFFDAELVRLMDKLEVDSRQYTNFQKKTRNKETDEFLSDLELIEEYAQRAALKMTYNKVVTIGVGYVRGDELRIKSIVGTEAEVIMQFCEVARRFSLICGFNIIQYDLPMIVVNGMRHFNVVEMLPDAFNTSGKKPWDMKNIIDLMDVFKGTHFGFPSFDEACAHFGIPSPKDDIDGSMVSKVYYEEGVERIAKYVKKDVLATVQLFQKLRFEEIFTEFTDVDSEVREVIEKSPVLERLYKGNELSLEICEDIIELFKGKELSTEEVDHIYTILRGVYVRTDFVNGDQDFKKVVEAKEEEIKELLYNIVDGE